MKHLKSTSSDLRRLFERAICVREIAEPLVSFDDDQDSESIRLIMETRNFDVVGVRSNGWVVGYVRRQGLKIGRSIGEYMIPFTDTKMIIAESDPLLSAIPALKDREQLFVSVLGKPGGIVTKGDLQKTPVRLWLFGMISLVEMQMLRLIRSRFPNETWASLLKENRLADAHDLFAERKRNNEEVSLADCLQICDKATILLKNEALLINLGFKSKTKGSDFFDFVQSLRNDLAHSNDILSGRWPELAERVVEMEQLLIRLESIA